MELIMGIQANIIREIYEEAFINKNSDYYQANITPKKTVGDDISSYDGYLWDCFKKPIVVTENTALAIASSHITIYVMCDLHSNDKILIQDYWKYPKDAVIVVNQDELCDYLHIFPEDVYLFDDSFSWTVALTHEYSKKGRRYCLLCNQTL